MSAVTNLHLLRNFLLRYGHLATFFVILGIKKPIEPNQNQEVFGGLSNLSGFSSMKYTGRKLSGYLYQRHLTGGIVDCFQTCLEAQENCKSFNFGKDTTQIDYICELNNATAAEQPSALVHWNSYNYYDCV